MQLMRFRQRRNFLAGQPSYCERMIFCRSSAQRVSAVNAPSYALAGLPETKEHTARMMLVSLADQWTLLTNQIERSEAREGRR
jgi:hypothetical protein